VRYAEPLEMPTKSVTINVFATPRATRRVRHVYPLVRLLAFHREQHLQCTVHWPSRVSAHTRRADLLNVGWAGGPA
jgi:hypothetical protein